MVPLYGPIFGPAFWGLSRISRALEALGVWQWFNYWASRVTPGKKLLNINMDETSVTLCPGARTGNTFHTARKRKNADEPTMRVTRASKRTNLTHVAFICDDVTLQPRLPQIIIGNARSLLARDMPGHIANAPPNVVLLRQKSSWNSVDVMLRIIRHIGRFLESVPEYEAVFYLDAARIHIHASIAAACRRKNIRLVILPAKLTWLLQPCDTHVFFRYKYLFKSLYHQKRGEHGNTDLPMSVFLRIV